MRRKLSWCLLLVVGSLGITQGWAMKAPDDVVHFKSYLMLLGNASIAVGAIALIFCVLLFKAAWPSKQSNHRE